ncbi:MAG: hypothetical protein LBG88_03515 [Christensenellaceae bacterium]|jgi:transcription initiation factor TFIIIB Brf1 subunit/transcription initiation factor TFIIB|nr:hypothetical protein [Christensenellaceae bacterium]
MELDKLKRVCACCRWVIDDDLADEIMKENNYDENDTKRPQAGDCCLNVDMKTRAAQGYTCKEHEFSGR